MPMIDVCAVEATFSQQPRIRQRAGGGGDQVGPRPRSVRLPSVPTSAREPQQRKQTWPTVLRAGPKPP